MPKKIKQDSGFRFKGSDEKLLRVDNVHYFIALIVLIMILICACVGGYVYSRDKYHQHKDAAFTNFEYTEKTDDGYVVYQVYLDEENKVYTYYNTPDGNTVQKKWSYGKYLDFNEEMYASGLFDQIFGAEVVIEDVDVEWSLNAELSNGKTIHNSSNFEGEVDKTNFAQVMKKYFKQEILHK